MCKSNQLQSMQSPKDKGFNLHVANVLGIVVSYSISNLTKFCTHKIIDNEINRNIVQYAITKVKHKPMLVKIMIAG